MHEGTPVRDPVDLFPRWCKGCFGEVCSVDGRFSFTVALDASRRGNDADGRHYTIAVSAKDNLGNPGFKSTLVTVPHG
jgi:hypothetical protein